MLCVFTFSGCFKSDPNQSIYESCRTGLELALLQVNKYNKWDLSNLEYSNILFKADAARNKKYETDQFVLFSVVMKNIPLENMHGKNMTRQIICSGYASQSPDEIRVDKNSLEYNAEGVLINIQVNHERNL